MVTEENNSCVLFKYFYRFHYQQVEVVIVTCSKLKLQSREAQNKEEQQEKLKRKQKAKAEERLWMASSFMNTPVSSGALGRQLFEDNGMFNIRNGGTHGIAASRISEVSAL